MYNPTIKVLNEESTFQKLTFMSHRLISYSHLCLFI